MNISELVDGIMEGLYSWTAYSNETMIEEPEEDSLGNFTILISLDGKEIQITVEELDHQARG